jgi:TrmH family RNA methyltransferase
MGAIARVRVHYLELESLLKEPAMKEKPVYATFLEGMSIYDTDLQENPLVLFGNESRGLTRKYDPYIHTRITIPSFKPSGSRRGSGKGSGKGSESLNLAASVAVICSEIRRRG